MSGPTRAELWARFGAPAAQEGSVNEPCHRSDGGVAWNEKWLYLDARGAPERIVLWYRYDLAGVFRKGEGGAWIPEDPGSDEA